MKILIVLLSTFMVSCTNSYQPPLIDLSNKHSIYINDVPSKIYGQITVCFFIANEVNVIEEIIYKVYFSANKGIRKVKRYRTNIQKKYDFTDNNTIVLDHNSTKAFTVDGFVKHKFIDDKFYESLQANFIYISNLDKLNVLEEIKNNLESSN